jgi:hypothetical protein
MKQAQRMKTATMLFCCIYISISLFAQETTITTNPYTYQSKTTDARPPGSKIADKLWQLIHTNVQNKSWSSSRDTLAFSGLNLRNNEVRILIEAKSEADVPALQSTLSNYGLSDPSVFENMIGGYMDIAKVIQLDQITAIRYVYPATRARRRSGVVTSQADKASHADLARQFYGVNGNGVKLGLISDSYNNDGLAGVGVQSGDLPGSANPYGFTKPVVVLKDYRNDFALDEGRALAEIVHDIAPAAELYYYTGYIDPVDFAAGIIALADAGCKIIVDDVAYFDEPFFQDGIINRAITKVKNRGVCYFTACGNSGTVSYEGRFKPIAGTFNNTPVAFHNFAANNEPPRTALQVKLPGYFVTSMVLQWDEPYYPSGQRSVKTDFDLLLTVTDESGTESFLDDADNIGGSPYALVGIFNDKPYPITVNVYLIRKGGSTAPRFVKLVDMSGGAAFMPGEKTVGINASTVVGHSNSADAISVGAAYYRKTQAFGAVRDSVQRYSSRGNTPIFFTREGRPTYQLRLKPEIVAADGANTSFFGFDFDGDGFPNFAGTSAAAPVAAAVAALSMEAAACRGNIAPDWLKWVMALTTNDMDDPATPRFDYGYDKATGFGFLRGDRVVRIFNRCRYNDDGDRLGNLPEMVSVEVFPNPVADQLQVQLKTAVLGSSTVNYTLTDVSGRRVLSGRQGAQSGIIRIPVKSLLPGTYYINLQPEGTTESITRSFIKR